jgi:2-oxoglutarate ferredoxin oxidoreductase subunit alpha
MTGLLTPESTRSPVSEKPAVTLDEHIIEVISDSGEGAQRCGQSLGAIAAKMGNGIWTVEIIPAEIQPPARSVEAASGVRIRIGRRRVTNGGDETDLVVAFNEQVLLGRVQAGEFKPGATILLERMWQSTPIRRSPTRIRRPSTVRRHRLPRDRDSDGGRVPQARERPAEGQEHVRARHPLQPLLTRPEARA